MRRLSWLVAVLLAGCGAPRPAPADPRPLVELRAGTRSETGRVWVTYRLRNDDTRPVVFHEQREPYVVTGPGDAVEIFVGRVPLPPDGHPTVPEPPTSMRVLAPGAVVEVTVAVADPPVDRPPMFERPRSSPAAGWSFCLGVTYLVGAAPTATGSLVAAVDFADEDYLCVPLTLASGSSAAP
ncbi:hypothetical protein F4553_003143 [Allocatelliglobosispora scoriae]|uniref:Lipoprotein n=1 Tax=Allocatelliglobosispora scoriae TaxID=643052 RepID=A0A841BNB9_9ACTN|nr:hypothetical protein [Allocatelliglobosispora scoriae]MBB5869764.1 hypothetical protein [Allocatelliglobosispora scoriae]